MKYILKGFMATIGLVGFIIAIFSLCVLPLQYIIYGYETRFIKSIICIPMIIIGYIAFKF